MKRIKKVIMVAVVAIAIQWQQFFYGWCLTLMALKHLLQDKSRKGMHGLGMVY